jgi:TonB family protein
MMLGKILTFVAALIISGAPTAAIAHCGCGHRDHVRTHHHRAARVDTWDTARFEVTAGRPCGNYPRSALRAQASGVTWVKLRLDEDGFVEASRISRSSGRADLDRAAIACVAGWHLGSGHEWRVARVSWRFHWHSWS